MTPDFAIEKIQEFIDCDGVQMIDIVTLITAQDALRKQVPKKPHVHPLYGQSYYNCPTCGAGKFAIMRGKKTRNDFCLKCGQALDWEDDHHAEG